MGQQFVARWVHTLFVGTIATLCLLGAQAAQAEHPSGWTHVVALAGADGGVCVEETPSTITFRGHLDASGTASDAQARATWQWRGQDRRWRTLGHSGWVAGGGSSGLDSEWRVSTRHRPVALRVTVQDGVGGVAARQQRITRLAACD